FESRSSVRQKAPRGPDRKVEATRRSRRQSNLARDRARDNPPQDRKREKSRPAKTSRNKVARARASRARQKAPAQTPRKERRRTLTTRRRIFQQHTQLLATVAQITIATLLAQPAHSQHPRAARTVKRNRSLFEHRKPRSRLRLRQKLRQPFRPSNQERRTPGNSG